MPSSKPKPLGQAVGQSGLNVGSAGAPAYDKTNFYMASIDSNKNSERIRTGPDRKSSSMRVPPFVVARATEWVDDPRTPYRALHDMLRDGLIHRTYELEEIAQTNPVTPSWQLARIHAEILQHSSFASRALSAIEDLKNILAEAWQSRDMVLWHRQIQNGFDLVEVLPAPYSELLRAHLESQQAVSRLPTAEGT